MCFIQTIEDVTLSRCRLVWCTVDGKRFNGLNIHGFSAIEVFAEIFSCCLDHKYSLFSIIKERHLHSWKIFRGTPENREKCKSLAQQIFAHLRFNSVKKVIIEIIIVQYSNSIGFHIFIRYKLQHLCEGSAYECICGAFWGYYLRVATIETTAINW